MLLALTLTSLLVSHHRSGCETKTEAAGSDTSMQSSKHFDLISQTEPTKKGDKARLYGK